MGWSFPVHIPVRWLHGCIAEEALILEGLGDDTTLIFGPLRPAGGDPEIDRQQKYFFDSLCFFE